MDAKLDRFFLAWRFDTDKHGRVIDLDGQIEDATKRFKRRFHIDPEFFIVGPHYIEGGQILVPSGYVYLALPQAKTKAARGDQHFATGYDM
jgi:hypothetical protein